MSITNKEKVAYLLNNAILEIEAAHKIIFDEETFELSNFGGSIRNDSIKLRDSVKLLMSVTQNYNAK